MRLSWNEVRARAAAFAEDWKDAAYEKGESAPESHDPAPFVIRSSLIAIRDSEIAPANAERSRSETRIRRRVR